MLGCYWFFKIFPPFWIFYFSRKYPAIYFMCDTPAINFTSLLVLLYHINSIIIVFGFECFNFDGILRSLESRVIDSLGMTSFLLLYQVSQHEVFLIYQPRTYSASGLIFLAWRTSTDRITFARCPQTTIGHCSVTRAMYESYAEILTK